MSVTLETLVAIDKLLILLSCIEATSTLPAVVLWQYKRREHAFGDNDTLLVFLRAIEAPLTIPAAVFRQ